MKRFNWTLRALIALFAASFVFTACQDDDDDDPTPNVPTDSIADIVTESDDFDLLEAALTQADLLSVFEGTDAYTVFAPTDAAFEAFFAADNGFDDLNDLTPAQLDELLTYHVVQGAALSSSLSDGQTLATLNADNSISVGLSGNAVTLNGSVNVTTANLEATNGVIHVIDAPLVPSAEFLPTQNVVEVASSDSQFSTLVTALQRFGLEQTLSDTTTEFTVFAPTNDAFTALLDSNPDWSSLDDIPDHTLYSVLVYHVVAGEANTSFEFAEADSLTTLYGEDVTLNGAAIDAERNTGVSFTPDVEATNGVIHVVDEVLLPWVTVIDATLYYNDRDGEFDALIGALDEANLIATLDDETLSVTVLAPNDAAFDGVTPPTGQALNDLLLYHVLTQEYSAADFVSGGDTSYPTLLTGESVAVALMSGTPTFDGAMPVTADIVCDNGTIHVIDAVLDPNE